MRFFFIKDVMFSVRCKMGSKIQLTYSRWWEKPKKGGRVREAEATFDYLDGRQSRLLTAFRLNWKLPCITRRKREWSHQKCYAAHTFPCLFLFMWSDFLRNNQHYILETYDLAMQLHAFLVQMGWSGLASAILSTYSFPFYDFFFPATRYATVQINQSVIHVTNILARKFGFFNRLYTCSSFCDISCEL
jgi:hypothetical protein